MFAREFMNSLDGQREGGKLSLLNCVGKNYL